MLSAMANPLANDVPTKSDRRQLPAIYARSAQRLSDDWHNVLLMCPRGQFGHHTAVSLMHGLAGNHVREQHTVAYHSARRVVARRFYSKYRYVAHTYYI